LKPTVIVVQLNKKNAFFSLISGNCKAPVIIKRDYANENTEQFQISAAIDFGALLIDGLIDGIWITAGKEVSKE